MFSGIIEELGTVKSLDKSGPITKLQVLASQIGSEIQIGQSVNVNGACLTVVERQKDLLIFQVMQETLGRSNLGLLKETDKVNLEPALRVAGRLDGHFVTGHIDGTGRVGKKQRIGSDIVMEIDHCDPVLRYIVLKGSVALDGVSLTVSAQQTNSFRVSLIPYTLKNTTLGLKKERDLVNIEGDILGKYVDRFLSLNKHPQPSITASFLKQQGFL